MRYFILEVMIVLGKVGDNTEPIWGVHLDHILRLKQGRDTEGGLCYGERETVVLKYIILVQRVEVSEDVLLYIHALYNTH